MQRQDWRTQYTLCPHVADSTTQATRHRGFRVCCDPCYDGGFMEIEDLTEVTHPEYHVLALPTAPRQRKGAVPPASGRAPSLRRGGQSSATLRPSVPGRAS